MYLHLQSVVPEHPCTEIVKFLGASENSHIKRQNKVKLVPSISFELIEGENLYSYVTCGYLASEDRQRISHIRVLFRQLVSVFKYLHLDVGLAHLDLKLDNLMLSFEKRKIKVIDFGLASKIRDENNNVITLADEVGNLNCRPPELLRTPL